MQRFVILEDGAIFKGDSIGAPITTTGEVVVNRAMNGYQEIITDPTYTGQIIVFTYPEIGNIGIQNSDYESLAPTCKGVIIGDLTAVESLHPDKLDLNTYLKHQHIPGICNIDTRALAHHLVKSNHIMKASIVDAADDHAFDQLKALVLPKNQVQQVATSRPYLNPGKRNHIVLIDLGLKNQLLRTLDELEFDITILPPTVTIDALNELSPDGILISNGPGNPHDLPNLIKLVQDLQSHYPFLGIGLGFELFALANGIALEPWPATHHGINYPVKDVAKTNKIEITTQNFCYRIKTETLNRHSEIRVAYVDSLDHTIVGLYHKYYPAFAVQFDPEAGPGPQDTRHIFSDFMSLINKYHKHQEG